MLGQRGATDIRDGVHLLALSRLHCPPAAVLQELQRGIDRARAGRIEPPAAVFHVFNHLVAVFGALTQQVQQGVLEVAATKHARPSVAGPHAAGPHAWAKREPARNAPGPRTRSKRWGPAPEAAPELGPRAAPRRAPPRTMMAVMTMPWTVPATNWLALFVARPRLPGFFFCGMAPTGPAKRWLWSATPSFTKHASLSFGIPASVAGVFRKTHYRIAPPRTHSC